MVTYQIASQEKSTMAEKENSPSRKKEQQVVVQIL